MTDEPHPTHLSIGQFATAAQLSIKALRLYQQLGLLTPAVIDPDSGYRYYTTAQLRRAKLIRLMRQMEMPLATIRQVLAAEPVAATALIEQYAQSFAARVTLVQETAETLITYFKQKETIMSFSVTVKQVEPLHIASITAQVRIAVLDSFIQNSLTTIEQYIAACGGQISGAPFGIYHGAVNEEDDGPVEVCWPLASVLNGSEEVTVRELAGGMVTAVAVHGSDCDFPAILGAYDAGVEWIMQNGYEIADSPREIWHSQPGAVAHMEILWPFRDKSA